MKIVVIEALGLHLGFVGCYGNDWTATPNLDRLAAEGIVFDWHFADQPELHANTPWQQRSIATGCYRWPGEAPGMVERGLPMLVRCDSMVHFAEQAWSAVAKAEPWVWIEGASLLPPWNLHDEMMAAYFDEEDLAENLVPWKDPPLGEVALTEPERIELQNTYAAQMTYFDAQLGSLLDLMRDAGMLDHTLICVTARSGLPLGEHGMIGTPRPALHDELVHVPLLLRLPGGASAGLRPKGLTQPVDLAPTFCEALGMDPASIAPMHGRSLWPLLRGEAPPWRPYAVSALRIGNEECRLLRSWDWAFHVHGNAHQLFAKPEDRWEVNDLKQQQIERAERMEQALRSFAAATRHPGPLQYPPIE
jgi:arylsulfatase A-like enzyme